MPWAQRVVEMVRELGGASEVSVVNQPWKTDVSRAALANGAMIGAFECEPLTGSHAAGTVLPAALAVSQREHRDGKAFLLSIAVGFEVSGRLQRTAVGLENKRGFHNPGVQGPFGAAAAVGKLYGFDAATLASALPAVRRQPWSSPGRRRYQARAPRPRGSMGLESALLAKKGLQGPVTVIEGPYGYFNAFPCRRHLEVPDEARQEVDHPARLAQGVRRT
jgi:2-methylcitrate dehydratase PrpD